jgi:hypothetical protein
MLSQRSKFCFQFRDLASVSSLCHKQLMLRDWLLQRVERTQLGVSPKFCRQSDPMLLQRKAPGSIVAYPLRCC